MLRRAASLWLWASMSACAAVPAAASTGLSGRGTEVFPEPRTVPVGTPAGPSGSESVPPASTITPAPSSPRALHYTFSLDAAFKSLSVRLCFDGAAPARLVCGMAKSANLMRDPRVVFEHGAELVRPLLREQAQVGLDTLAADSC